MARGNTWRVESRRSGRRLNPWAAIELAVLDRCQEQTRRWGEQMAAEFPLFRGFTPVAHDEQRMGACRLLVRQSRDAHRRSRSIIAIGSASATGIVLPNGSIVFDSRRNRDVPLVDREQYLALLDIASFQASVMVIANGDPNDRADASAHPDRSRRRRAGVVDRDAVPQ